MAHYANAVAAKARAMYGRRLTAGQYDELAHKQSVQEIAAYLKGTTSYSQALAELQESTARRELMESLLRQDTLYQYARLVKFAGKDSALYRWVIMEIEIQLILDCLREIVLPSGEDLIAGMPMFVQQYICFDLYKITKAQSFDALCEAIENTPYVEILRKSRQHHKDLETPFLYASHESALRRYYFETLLADVGKHTKGQSKKQLTELVLMRAELMNINVLYRIKANFKLDRAQIQQRMLPFYGKVTPRIFTKMVEAANLEEFMALLRQTPYGGELLGKDMFEDETLRVIRRQEHRLMRFATDPQVVYTVFMLLHGIELENITRIIEGVRYQLPPDQIKSLLCL